MITDGLAQQPAAPETEDVSMADYIALIRCKASRDAAARLVEELRDTARGHDSSMVFIHGDAVASIPAFANAAPDPGADWVVCRTSLARRTATDMLPQPFRIATLTAFYESVLSANRIDSLGLGGQLCFKPGSAAKRSESGPLLLEIGFAPLARHQHRETLEMALGAAALELDATVLFTGEGLAHLEGVAARGWSQITDFDLLDLHCETPARRFAPEIAVPTLDPVDVARLRARAATILIL